MRRHYVESAWTKPPTELIVDTNMDGWSTEPVTFLTHDERATAEVRLTRTDVSQLHAQLGAWLAVTPE